MARDRGSRDPIQWWIAAVWAAAVAWAALWMLGAHAVLLWWGGWFR